MKSKKDDELDASINSEIVEAENSVSDKFKKNKDFNSKIIVSATFSRKNSLNSRENASILNESYNQSVISNQIQSSFCLSNKNLITVTGNKYTHTDSGSVNIGLAYNNQTNNSYQTYYLPSTTHNSQMAVKHDKPYVSESTGNLSQKFYSPQKKVPVMPNNKMTYSYNKSNQVFNEYFDEGTVQEIKKASMLLKLKEKEIKDLMKNYELIKDKFKVSKLKLSSSKVAFDSVRKSNLNVKKIICGIIKNSNEKKS